MSVDPSELARARMSRLAWAVLVISFAIFLGLVIGIPLGINAYLQHATRPLYLTVRPVAGNLALQPGPRSQTILVKQGYEGLPEESVLELETGQSAVLLAYAQEGAPRSLATLYLYGPLQMKLHSATRPRFAQSPESVQLDLSVTYGRLGLVLDPQSHPVQVELSTPQGLVRLSDGTAQLSVSSQNTRLEVYSGGATLGTRREQQPVPPGSRGVLGQTGLISLESPNTPLLHNGDFAAGFAEWQSYTRQVEPSGKGGATLSVVPPRAVLHIWRSAEGTGESGLTQALGGRRVPSASGRALHLKALVRIEEQALPLCGPRGDRCPITLRLYYRDAVGAAHVWEQGFYALGDTGPNVCLDCEMAVPLQAVPLKEWTFYESPNLLSLAPAPVTLDAVEIAADGSHYRVELDDIRLDYEE